ncbi:hypothetical protein VDGL01_12430 [Verticillium dahliae]
MLEPEASVSIPSETRQEKQEAGSLGWRNDKQRQGVDEIVLRFSKLDRMTPMADRAWHFMMQLTLGWCFAATARGLVLGPPPLPLVRPQHWRTLTWWLLAASLPESEQGGIDWGGGGNPSNSHMEALKKACRHYCKAAKVAWDAPPRWMTVVIRVGWPRVSRGV